MEKSNSSAQALLHQIADALGVPVEKFLTNPSLEENPASTEQCLRLWSKITTDEGRLQALAALRSIVEAEQR